MAAAAAAAATVTPPPGPFYCEQYWNDSVCRLGCPTPARRAASGLPVSLSLRPRAGRRRSAGETVTVTVAETTETRND